MRETKAFGWLAPILQPLRPTFREAALLSLFVNLVALAVPVFVLQVYDRVVFHAGMTTLQGLVIGMTALLVFDFILRQARSRLMQRVALRIDVQVGERLFAKLMALPLRSLEGRPASFWQMLFRDVDTVRNTLSGPTAVLALDLPFAFLFLAIIFLIAPPLAWVFVAMAVAFTLLAWYSGRVLHNEGLREQQGQAKRDALVAEIVAGRGTVKALALDRALRPLWEDRQAATINTSIQRGGLSDGFINLSAVLALVSTVLLTTVGAVFIVEQQLTIGALVASNMLAARLIAPMGQLVGGWRAVNAFRQSLQRLGRVFAEAEDRTESTLAHERPKGEVALENLSFAYDPDAKPVFSGITCRIPLGITAIVGRNGSGKTTLLKLLQGLYRPTEGRVLLDGADIAQFSRSELASWIGYVPQDCVLFDGTIRDNMVAAMPEASDEDVLRAARMAGVHHYIANLPDGYGTAIGEAGARLSGGQRQRLAIARALIGQPPVLLLDEPSSSLDHQAEEELRDTLVTLAKERAVLVVSHSPVLLPACQHVMVLDGGKLAAFGPAAQILPRLMGTRRPVPANGAQPQRVVPA
ncbi:peptidase domain-containing ABC transporter [Telmatospirillum sp. J64-1]|uniref:peptidase domain-containing ABC transporter n=1 Tax=Telmatospirillum sp. J64-1 TaxID=2502183 RepID=UPI00115EF731|nr:ATP-binding cassette domain-containing protein [Telmatospirillum sp. J64-1]